MCLSLESDLRMAGCVLDVLVLPCICCVGVALNILCLLVFASHRSHPLVPALTLLSLCDLLQLFLSFFVLFLPAIIDFFELPTLSWTGQIAYLATGALAPLLLASNCASIWTITYISVERHRAITKPLSTVQSSPQVVPLIVIAIFALLFNAPKWAEYEWEWQPLQNITVLSGYLEGTAPDYFLLHRYSPLYHNERYKFARELVLYPFLVYFIPLCLLSILNLRILLKISFSRMTSTHRSRLAQETRTIALLIAIVLLFFCCHTGGLVIRFIDHDQKGDDDEWFVLVKDIINILFNINSMANPMLYFLFTRQFRDLSERYIAAHFYSGSTRNSLAHIHNKGLITSSTTPQYMMLECGSEMLNGGGRKEGDSRSSSCDGGNLHHTKKLSIRSNSPKHV